MATEKRLIDANAMRQHWLDNGENEYVYDTNSVLDSIDEQPTVDVVEVVHGRWEEWWPGISLIMTGEEMLYRCSACDAKYPDVEGYKYCPNCGAKMDKNENT